MPCSGCPLSTPLEKVILDLASETKVSVKLCKEKPPVTIIGAGPAGIAFGIYMTQYGYRVTIYERENQIGGMMRYGIPDFRFNKDVIQELEVSVKKMGIKIKKNISYTKCGKGITVVATGAGVSKKLGIEGEDNSEFVIGALEFLKQQEHDICGKKVAIIGGGNVAVDCAMVTATQGADATIYYRKNESDLSICLKERVKSRKQGVHYELCMSPKRFEDKKIIFEKDGEEIIVKADIAIVAIGQGIDTNVFKEKDLLFLGDCVTGTSTVIDVIGAARKLANELNHVNDVSCE